MRTLSNVVLIILLAPASAIFGVSLEGFFDNLLPDPFFQLGQFGLQDNCLINRSTKFNICLDMVDPSGKYEQWMNAAILARDRWERIIVGDTFREFDPPAAVTPASAFPDKIDDIYIAMNQVDDLDDIDVNGNVIADILASATVTSFSFRTLGDGRRVQGTQTCLINFDINDTQRFVDELLFRKVALHEIGHCLGIGLQFETNDLLKTAEGLTPFEAILSGCTQTDIGERLTCLATTDLTVEYVGPKAQEAWEQIGCSGKVPVQQVDTLLDALSSIVGFHWDEQCLNNELMTENQDFETGGNKLSQITIQGLADVGYEVNSNAGDVYGLSDLGTCGAACPELEERTPFAQALQTFFANALRFFFGLGPIKIFGSRSLEETSENEEPSDRPLRKLQPGSPDWDVLNEGMMDRSKMMLEKDYGSIENAPSDIIVQIAYLDQDSRLQGWSATMRAILEHFGVIEGLL